MDLSKAITLAIKLGSRMISKPIVRIFALSTHLMVTDKKFQNDLVKISGIEISTRQRSEK